MKLKIIKTCNKCKYIQYEHYGNNQCSHPIHWTATEKKTKDIPEEFTCPHFTRNIGSYISEFFRYLKYLKHKSDLKKLEKYKNDYPERFFF